MVADRRMQNDIREQQAAEKQKREDGTRAREIRNRDRQRIIDAEEFKKKTEDIAKDQQGKVE